MLEWQWRKMRSESDQTWSRLNRGDKEVSECLLLLSYFVGMLLFKGLFRVTPFWKESIGDLPLGHSYKITQILLKP